MTAFRFSNIAGFRAAMLLAILISSFVGAGAAAAAVKDLHRYCRKVGNDDTIREYTHDLYGGTVEAFKRYAPEVKETPADSDFWAQAQYRCMNGKIMVCFVGANLPCVKINASRHNAGAEAACREDPNSDYVSPSQAGHDALYSFRCRNGKAEITGQDWELDERGFAKKLWTQLPDR